MSGVTWDSVITTTAPIGSLSMRMASLVDLEAQAAWVGPMEAADTIQIVEVPDGPELVAPVVVFGELEAVTGQGRGSLCAQPGCRETGTEVVDLAVEVEGTYRWNCEYRPSRFCSDHARRTRFVSSSTSYAARVLAAAEPVDSR